MNRPAYRIPVALALLAIAAACDNDPVGPDEDVTECATTLTAAQGDAFVQLCELDAVVRHVRIENLRAPAPHASAQIVFGFDAPPASPTAALAADQFRVLFYGGAMPFPPPVAQASFGDVDVTLGDDASFVRAGATVCFDLHDGSASTAPAFVLWVDGVKGADCDSKATLTAASAYSAVAHWGGAHGAIDKLTNVYFRQSAAGGTTPKITLLADPVLDATAIAAATTCNTTWATNTDWQQLCAPAIGTAKHVRIRAVNATANNSYFYAVLGQDPSPTGNPAGSAGKLIVTGGRSNSGTSWTWFRFGTGSTTQYSYATDAGSALYTAAPATVCFDLGAKDDGAARFVFWSTGSGGANCDDVGTLRLDNALYDSSTDPATAGIWNAPYVAGKLNFIKTSSATATVGQVTVSSEAAAL